jgi:predicted alpha/beta hydrolase family esterase
MKKQVVFIHGGDAFTKREDFLEYLRTMPLRSLPGKEAPVHWTQTLTADLGEDYEVFMLSMPNKHNASFDEWSIWFERYFEYLRDGAVLVGWSLGGMFLAKYLSENQAPFAVGRLLLLAAPCGRYSSPDGNDCGTFQFDPAILTNLSKQIKNIEIWHSEDDFVVDFADVKKYQKALPEATFKGFIDKNHFLTPTFPELLQSIKIAT